MNYSETKNGTHHNHIEGPKTSGLRDLPVPVSGVDMTRLIGKPHLFGRVKHIREGLLVEPIGVLTLQPDGRVTGYGHPNEGSWIPYTHGTVSGDQAFAFVTAHNNWIPSSTWTQSMGDIPVGYFCGGCPQFS